LNNETEQDLQKTFLKEVLSQNVELKSALELQEQEILKLRQSLLEVSNQAVLNTPAPQKFQLQSNQFPNQQQFTNQQQQFPNQQTTTTNNSIPTTTTNNSIPTTTTTSTTSNLVSTLREGNS